ncbi:hypothetical protein NMH_1696 [Neisseria meningitidis H44/76]|uniref:Uncharacterized protein n=5 Tax=Neisseria meningitidis TaxID=487 RepID=E6MZ24_NEIMH|nr:hypothetical protein NMBB_1404 [Neisseria meningitidis alpha710]AHW75929.1 hypothetical protein NMA510612_1643 [Neisseria meningitidis]EFH22942.1 hypothetical protein NEIPOLOT_01267 [Neisseria polysaccharea ATCC 43768]EFM04636.1 hypothetical protein HMPREF0602_0850 [Neisseria meningitidis ATCC 13091]EFV63045.1 hypothetical protein NMH_1696 [Neisseria meningitidis H44/76]CBA06224.1 hypothetical protein NMO_1119 [Neisseria meningitidis alpha14]CCA44532.1 hypothetical protein NMALPHA522_0991 
MIFNFFDYNNFGRFVHFVIRKPVFYRQVLTALPDDRVCLFLTKE